MAQVLSFGYAATSLFAEQDHIDVFPVRPPRAELERLVQMVRQALERKGHVVALYPEWAAEPARQRIQLARAALETSRLVAYGSSLPPLAGGVLASLASAAVRHVPSTGALLSALPRLERELYVIAWLGSVTGLKHPAPTMLQHVVSMSPGTGFAVCVAPDLFVKRISKKDRSLAIRKPSVPLNLVVAGRDGDLNWVQDEVPVALGGAPVKEIEASALAQEWWGTAKVIEAVGYPIDVAVVAKRALAGITLVDCRWCGEHFTGDRCPFCGIRPTAALAEGVA